MLEKPLDNFCPAVSSLYADLWLHRTPVYGRTESACVAALRTSRALTRVRDATRRGRLALSLVILSGLSW